MRPQLVQTGPWGALEHELHRRVCPLLETHGPAFCTPKSVSHWQWPARGDSSQSLRAAITRTTDCVAYKQQKFICHSCGGRKSEIKIPA